jgi:hypothetical protein
LRPNISQPHQHRNLVLETYATLADTFVRNIS